MTISLSFKRIFACFVIFQLLFLVAGFASAQRNFCRECQVVTDVAATHCPECGLPLNLCLDCNTANPVNVDHCINCNASLAEMRVLGSIDEETRERLKLGQSERAELEKELMKLNYLLEQNPDEIEKLLFRKGKILHRMDFYSQEAQLWKEYLRLFPETNRKAFIKIYLSEALRKWGYLFYQQKNFVRARQLFKEASEANAANKEAWQWLGRISMESKDKETARQAYMQALELEPGNKTLIHFLRRLNVKVPEELKRPEKKNTDE